MRRVNHNRAAHVNQIRAAQWGTGDRRMRLRILFVLCLWGWLSASPFSRAEAAEEAVDLGGVREEHVMIPMRDGKRLSAYLYFPPGNGPWPVLYEQRYADMRGASSRQAYARLAQGGYVVCGENFR